MRAITRVETDITRQSVRREFQIVGQRTADHQIGYQRSVAMMSVERYLFDGQ